MPAPSLQTQGTVAAVTTGNLAITLPAYQANDIVVITTVGWVPNTTTGTNTQSLSSPWTKYTPAVTTITGGIIDAEYAFWWARATSTTSLGSTVTITRPTSWDTGNDTCWAGRAYVVRGCVTTGNPYDQLTVSTIGSTANPALPAVTVSGGNRQVIAFLVKADDAVAPTTASGYTIGTAATTTTGTDAGFQTYWRTASANVSAVTPSGGTAPAQGGSVYFALSFVPAPVMATLVAPLGSVSGSSSATPNHLATLVAPLGSLTGTAIATTPITASATAQLGAVISSLSATVKVVGSAVANLSSVIGSAVASVRIPVTASAPLGSVTSSGSSTVIHLATASSSAAVSSNATATVTPVASASASLGTIGAVAVAVVIPPTPPIVSSSQVVARPTRIIDIRPARLPEPRTPDLVMAQAVSRLGSVMGLAGSSIVWSTVADEDELLMLL